MIYLVHGSRDGQPVVMAKAENRQNAEQKVIELKKQDSVSEFWITEHSDRQAARLTAFLAAVSGDDAGGVHNAD